MSEVGDILLQILAWCCSVASIALYASSWYKINDIFSLTMIEIIKAKSTGEYSFFVYLTQFINAFCNTAYGAFKPNWNVLAGNATGILFNVIYHCIFWKYCSKTMRKHSIISFIISLICLIGLTVGLYFIGIDVAINVFGVLTNITGIIQCGSPLVKIPHIIKTKTSDGIPVPFVCAFTVNCILWTIYGIFIEDYYIITVNGAATLCGIIQLIIAFIFPNKPIEKDNTTVSPEVTLKKEISYSNNVIELEKEDRVIAIA